MTTERSYTAFSGYTKHYFAGTERLASAIGNGGLADIGIVGSDGLIDKHMERDSLLRRVMAPYPLRINRNRLDTLYAMTQPDTLAELTYFFHPDHLGSASWITDLSGQPVQHLQYKPFGGDYINQQAPGTDYAERFRFTGKERDAETGYDYFGARYYSSSLGIWLSVDPMSDKYPSLSPYVYCADNPMRLVDVEGNDIQVFEQKDNKTGKTTVIFYVTMRVENHSMATWDVISERAAGIKQQIEASFKGDDRKTNTQYETRVLFVSSTEEQFVLDFVNDIKGGNSMTAGKIDEIGNVIKNTIQVEIDGYKENNIMNYNQSERETSRTGAHEYGHALGLRHGNDSQNELSFDNDNLMNQSGKNNKSTKITIEQLEAARNNVNKNMKK